ncbi:glutamine amidotransferase class-II [Rippkaea orientalis PCC 8801]|uniref:Glutamine amidotransferase class-II n=1 Tax=Rippkaea orientalis (strain PCC 8801 / RF-1) TaxID=41431 RepID=B7JY55_RIPO1|nr:ergothioneine biosynthesis protein EgtC [Rippkaea orientalis]ACK67157.1 glutamine amidotransferase class-II [Rippkaea orientalis PCC 8801]
MCRLLGYFGQPIQLDRLLYQPEHSLIVQSYKPREMTAGLVNADGFGVGWYHPNKTDNPYIYKNILPIWSDINLPHLSRYVESRCVLSYVRSATPPLAVDLSNCQPFTQQKLLFIHNGFIHNFRQNLYRPLRNQLTDEVYQMIHGTTDSEHMFALILTQLQTSPNISLATALHQALIILIELAKVYHIYFSANIIISDGQQLVASRYANRSPNPTLYWLENDPSYPNSVIIASEPLFEGNWNKCPEHSIITLEEDLEVNITTV